MIISDRMTSFFLADLLLLNAFLSKKSIGPVIVGSVQPHYYIVVSVGHIVKTILHELILKSFNMS